MTINAAVAQHIPSPIVTAFVQPHNSYIMSYIVWLVILALAAYGCKRFALFSTTRTYIASLRDGDQVNVNEAAIRDEPEGKSEASTVIELDEARPASVPSLTTDEGV
ncbi:MAG TPA: hypothetical protein VIJ40_02370 [Acidimicrobiales bacterium]